MENKGLYIDKRWSKGQGNSFYSLDPSTQKTLWSGSQASFEDIQRAMDCARKAFTSFSKLSWETRCHYLERFTEEMKKKEAHLAFCITKEVGKPLWESQLEVKAILSKVDISIKAYRERTGSYKKIQKDTKQLLSHRAHGVVAVFGPFNFPAHIPCGHIIPALLAGNTVIFKPSEWTPLVGQELVKIWHQSGLPKGVLNLIQGQSDTGKLLSQHPQIDGLFFTGSSKVGKKLSIQFGRHPEKILALELGGNNPLIVHQVKNIEAACYHIIQSAFITSGQRCSCARRLILTQSRQNQKLLEALIDSCQNIQVGLYTEKEQAFMGTVISSQSAQQLLNKQNRLLKAGGKLLLKMKKKDSHPCLLTPGIIDVSKIARCDEEIFGPLIQVIFVKNLSQAILEANHTRYGLAAGLLSDHKKHFLQFFSEIRAGIVNWNSPTTGASSNVPFGGVKMSGNHRPSAYYAADYCAYPIASIQKDTLSLPEKRSPGIF